MPEAPPRRHRTGTTHAPEGCTNPLVSVVMPCRNGLPYLHEALWSLRAQRYAPWELVFVDGGSTDGSAALVRMAVPDAIILHVPPGTPAGAARNAGLAAASGSLIAFLDADDVWEPQKLVRQVAGMLHTGARLSYTDCTLTTPGGERLGRHSRLLKHGQGEVFHRLVRRNFVPFSTVMASAELVARVGGFSPVLEIAGDYQWLLRAASITAFGYVPRTLAGYRVRPDSLSGDFRATYRENVRLLAELADAESVGSRRELLMEARTRVMWRWCLREAASAPAGLRRAVRLARRALRSGRSVVRSMALFPTTVAGGLKGLRLRLRMFRVREGDPCAT